MPRRVSFMEDAPLYVSSASHCRRCLLNVLYRFSQPPQPTPMMDQQRRAELYRAIVRDKSRSVVLSCHGIALRSNVLAVHLQENGQCQ